MSDQNKKIASYPMLDGGCCHHLWVINETIKYDHNTRTILHGNGDKFYIRKKTGDILLYFIENQRKTVGIGTFFEVIWKHDCVSKNVLAQSISELRKALLDTSKEIICTVPKLGYKFNASAYSKEEDRPFIPDKKVGLFGVGERIRRFVAERFV